MSDQGRRLGVGVVGLGWMGRLHSRSYLAAAEKYPDLNLRPVLRVAADPIPANREFAINSLGYERAVSDAMEVIADPAVEAVSICSPNALHEQFATAAAQYGKPFWIEKPMGRNAEESRRIASAAEAAGIVTGVGFNYRHAPAVAYARNLIRSGELGEITNVRCWFFADYASDPAGMRTWRFERDKAGSGALGDIMSHGFDLAQYLVGAVTEVSALSKTVIRERPEPLAPGATPFQRNDEGQLLPVENEDYAGILARFANGAVGVFEASRVITGPRAEYVIEVYGTKGSVRWNFESLNILDVARGPSLTYGYTRLMADPTMPNFSHFQPGAGTSMGFDDLKAIEAMQFMRSVLEGTQLSPSAADGLSAANIAAAAELSSEDGLWHPVEPSTGRTTFDADPV